MNFYYKPNLKYNFGNSYMYCPFNTIPNLTIKFRYELYDVNKTKHCNLIIQKC